MSIVRHLGELGHRRRGRRSRRRASPSRASALLKPLLRAAIVKLADMRLTSYSNGPGSVSSKSFRSNSRLPLGRGEHTEVRQVGIAAELNVEAGPGRVLQVGGHDLGRAPVERERRDHHPSVAHRHQVGLTRRVLLLQQGDRIGAVRGRLPARVAGRSHLLPQLLTLRSTLLDARVLDFMLTDSETLNALSPVSAAGRHAAWCGVRCAWWPAAPARPRRERRVVRPGPGPAGPGATGPAILRAANIIGLLVVAHKRWSLRNSGSRAFGGMKLLGFCGRQQADPDEVERADEPVADTESHRPCDCVAQRHRPVVLEQDQRGR